VEIFFVLTTEEFFMDEPLSIQIQAIGTYRAII
jgi:hypothetical protein